MAAQENGLHDALPEAELEPQVDLVSADGDPVKNETHIQIEELIDDWMHFRNLPSISTIFVALATVVNNVLDLFIDFQFDTLMSTLAYVEAPHVVVPAPWTSKKDDDSDEAPKVQQERSITTSLRTTVRHLYRIGGATAYFRGLACSLCTTAVYFVLVVPMVMAFHFPMLEALDSAKGEEPLTTRLGAELVPAIGHTAIMLLLVSWEAALVHIMITQPTLRIWYRRLPPFLPTLRATWRPLLLSHFADTFTWDILPILLKSVFGLYQPPASIHASFVNPRKALRSLIWLVSFAINIYACIPLRVTTVRVQASLLPDDEDTIVPFDRSFGTSGTNGLKPGLLAESRGPLSFREAWQSITRAEFWRITVFSAKMVALRAVVNGAFWPVLGNSVIPNQWVPWKF